MDFSSGLLWSDLKDILMDNSSTDEFEAWRTMMIGNMQNIAFMLSSQNSDNSNSKLSVLISGSFAEITSMLPYIQRREKEVDVMIVPRDFVISRDMQPSILQDVPDEPGFVRVKAPDDLRESELLEVKRVIDSGGCSRVYIISDKEKLLKKFEGFQKFQNIYNALHIGKVIEMEYRQGPALTITYKGCHSILKSISDPQNGLFQFLGHVSNRVFEHFDDNINENLKENFFVEVADFMKSSNLQIPDIVGLMVDICPAIKCEGWPHKALRFFHRTRVWPDQTMLDKLLQGGFHLVYKPLNPRSQDLVEWRISFSQAELSLFQNMENFRVYCYCAFKRIYYNELTLPKVLCSYHLKTIFLWACERIPPVMWVESNLAQIIMGLLDDLLYCLVTKSCPHYFIPENDLFAHVHQDFLDHLAKVVTKIRRNPRRYLSVRRQVVNLGDQDTDIDKEDVSSFGDIELD